MKWKLNNIIDADLPPDNRLLFQDKVKLVNDIRYKYKGRIIAFAGTKGKVLACGITPLTKNQWVELMLEDDKVICCMLHDVVKID